MAPLHVRLVSHNGAHAPLPRRHLPKEFYWRPEISLLLVSGLMGIAWRTWGGPARWFAVGFGVIVLVVALIPYSMPILNRVLLLAVPLA